MNEIERIGKLLKQTFEGRGWHGPGLLELLDDVTAEQAAAPPAAGAHSIWGLTLHLIYTQERVLERLTRTGGRWDADRAFPPLPKDCGEAAWRKTIDTLKVNEMRLRLAIANFPIDQLDVALFEGSGRAYTNMHGYMDHMVYHAGQIALLKRAYKEANP